MTLEQFYIIKHKTIIDFLTEQIELLESEEFKNVDYSKPKIMVQINFLRNLLKQIKD